MNIRIDYYEESEISHGEKSPELGKRTRPVAARRATNAARRVKGPTQANGIHRRRRKRIMW